MKWPRHLDAFQLIGFALSIMISLSLLFIGYETLQSVILGLCVAILTQLLDFQIRQMESVTKTLDALALEHDLYEDEWLRSEIEQIVRDYLAVRTTEFDLFKQRASEAIEECKTVIHRLTEGNLIAKAGSSFRIGNEFYRSESTIKQTITKISPRYWRSEYQKSQLESNRWLIENGLKFSRIYLLSPEEAAEFSDVLTSQHAIGMEIYVVNPEMVSNHLKRDFIILDDWNDDLPRTAILELTADGSLIQQRISIRKDQKRDLLANFRMLLHHAVLFSPDEPISGLK